MNGVRLSARADQLFSVTLSRPFWGPHTFLSNACRVLSVEVNRQECDCYDSPPTRAKVKSAFSYLQVYRLCVTSVLLVVDSKTRTSYTHFGRIKRL
jgi:hypothetical protein